MLIEEQRFLEYGRIVIMETNMVELYMECLSLKVLTGGNEQIR